MPIIDPDQGVPLPAGTDLADNPAAFSNFYTPVMSRLILRYASRAARTALHPAPILNETSIIDGETWYERWTGSKWIPATPIAAQKMIDQSVNNTTVLVNVTSLVVPLPTASTAYTVEAFIFYEATTVADIKFALTVPGGGDVRFGGSGLAIGAAGPTGDGNFGSALVGGSLSFGGSGIGTLLVAHLVGRADPGASTGNLQLQFAQNTAEVSNTRIIAGSWLMAQAIA